MRTREVGLKYMALKNRPLPNQTESQQNANRVHNPWDVII